MLRHARARTLSLLIAVATLLAGTLAAPALAASVAPVTRLSPAMLFALTIAAPMLLLLAGFVATMAIDILRRN